MFIAKPDLIWFDERSSMSMKSTPSPHTTPGRKWPEWIALLGKVCLIVFQKQRYRRNLLFALTLLALVMVFAGAIPRGEALLASPIVFFVYWVACLLLVCSIIGLAYYDLKQASLTAHLSPDIFLDELLAAEDEARQLAESELAAMQKESDEQNNVSSHIAS
jgi:hypothetical protein